MPRAYLNGYCSLAEVVLLKVLADEVAGYEYAAGIDGVSAAELRKFV